MTNSLTTNPVLAAPTGVMQLSKEETLRRLPYNRLVPEVHRAARELREGKIQAPPRLVTPMENSNGSVMCMPANAADLSIVKLLTVLPDNGPSGLPTVQGQVSVFDATNGRLLAQLDAEAVTSRRTAAVSLAGAERLLSGGPRSMMVVGTGVQAAAHIEAFASYFGTTKFHVAARNISSGEAMRARLLQNLTGLDISLVSVGELGDFEWSGIEAVLCATTATAPVLPADVPASVLVVGVGAYRPDMIELPRNLLRNRKVIVDTLEGAQHEAGDLINAELDWREVTELCDLAEPVLPDTRNFVLKTVGHAAWDLAACRTAIG